MTIVLNEHEWAEEMILSHSLGKKPFETLTRVARYYLDNGNDKKATRMLLDAFILQCDPSASVPKWSNTLDFALSRALKVKAVQVDNISITKSEMAKISALKGKQIKRLAFTLLCLSKYWDIANPNGDHWVNNRDSEIMSMANINTSIKRQSLMYHELKEAGLIQFSKKVDNTNVRVCFSDNSETALKINDFRNLGYQYVMACGSDDYFVCENCGMVTKRKAQQPDSLKRIGRPQKYCNGCAVKIKMMQNVNSAMRIKNAV